MTDPINWFFNTMLSFWNKYTRLNNFTSPTGYINGADMRIIGAFQPLDCLSNVWPMDSVVSFEDIIDHFEKNQSNLGSVVKIDNVENVKLGTLDNWEEFKIAA